MAMTQCEGIDADEPVIEAIRAGDRHAFAEFMRLHSGWVRGVIFGVLGDAGAVDDAAQQAWTAVWRRIGELRDTKRWRPWVYRLARNAAIDAGRDATRRRGRTQALPPDLPAGSGDAPDAKLVGRERHGDVLAAIRSLPTLYREPFVMRHLNQWSYAEISEAIGMPIDSVETRLVRARRLLRDFLKDKVF